MADLYLGERREVIITGVHDAAGQAVKSNLETSHVDLSPLYGPDNRVAALREMAGRIVTPSDPEWVGAVDQLFDEVEELRQPVTDAGLNGYKLGRMGPAIPSLHYTKTRHNPPQGKFESQPGHSYSGRSKFNFLSAPALKVLGHQPSREKSEADLSSLAVVLTFREIL